MKTRGSRKANPSHITWKREIVEDWATKNILKQNQSIARGGRSKYMFITEALMSIEKEKLPEAAKALSQAEISALVELLSDKNDKIRYQAFLLLQCRSQFFDDVYGFWEVFRQKLKDNNSYQRSIGIMLMAENARWDTEDKTEAALEDCRELLRDDKPITVRQSIQSLGKIAEAKPKLNEKTAAMLMAVDLPDIKETMRKSVLFDILNVLVKIRKCSGSDTIDSYIINSISGGILDKKTANQIDAMLSL